MEDSIQMGLSKGFRRFSLIVEKASPDLESYYASFGFVPENELVFFGEGYRRMILDIRD